MKRKSKTRQRWTRELVIRRILERQAHRLLLNYWAVVTDDEPLNGAARRYFGSWEAALQAAGIDPATVKNPRDGHNPPGTWTNERVLSAIQGHAARGADLAAHRMQKSDPKLVAAATARFGSWRKAIEQAGFDYAEIRLTRDWPRQRIIARLRQIARDRGDLSYLTAEAWDNSFVAAAVAAFGSWDRALDAADISPQRRTVRWNGRRILQAIRQGKATERGGLRKAAMREFGSWQAAL